MMDGKPILDWFKLLQDADRKICTEEALEQFTKGKLNYMASSIDNLTVKSLAAAIDTINWGDSKSVSSTYFSNLYGTVKNNKYKLLTNIEDDGPYEE